MKIFTKTHFYLFIFWPTLTIFAQIPHDPFQWLEPRQGEAALNWIKKTSSLTEEKIKNNSLFAEFLQIAQDSQNYRTSLERGKLIKNKIYRLTHEAYYVQKLKSYREGRKQWKEIFHIKDMHLPGQVRLESMDCFLPKMQRCLVSYALNKQRVFIAEVDIKKRELIADGFHLNINGDNRIRWVDEDNVLVAAPYLTSTSSTADGNSREVRLWRRGEELKKTKILIQGKQNDIGFFPWVMHSKEGQVNYISYWYADGTGQLYFFKDGNLKKVLHPTNMTSFHSYYQGSILIQLFEDWREFKKNDVVKIKLETSVPELIYRPESDLGINDIHTTHSRIFMSYTQRAQKKVAELYKNKNGQWIKKIIPFSKNTSLSISSANYFNNTVLYQEESFIQAPRLILREKNKSQIVQKAPAFFDKDKFETIQLYAESKDGQMIPFFLTKAKELKLNKTHPTLLYGYGAFGQSLTPTYRPEIGKAWLEKGGIYVVANIRGGGELGVNWRLQGSGAYKQNSFNDFYAVAEKLIELGYTSTKQLAIQGGSAGGLLVSVAMHQRPDLFAAIVATYPLIDVFQLQGSHADTYGDPQVPEQLAMIKNYDPMSNILAEKKYPAIFLLTSTQDQRVPPLHSRKFAAKLISQGHQDVYFYERNDASHSEFDALQMAMLFSFLHSYVFY